MKTRIVIIIILLLVLSVLLTRNDDRLTNTLLSVINPIKQNYKSITQDLESKSHSYIFQKESIEKLTKENRILRRRLLEQMHYIDQVKDIYDVLPDLSRLPLHNISIVDTISYVKLNSFSQIILTKPKGLEENRLYGMIHGTVVAGVAEVKNGQLYGYLTSDEKCRFSVFIGEKKAPGIAIGHSRNEMIIKFIPKWHKIEKGDRVFTSGLDNIFFAKIPVGIVERVEVQSAYTVAYIKTYSEIYNPKTFFIINNPKVTLLQKFDSNTTRLTPYYIDLENIKRDAYFKDLHKEKLAKLEAEANVTMAIENNNSLPQAFATTISESNQTEEPILSSIPNRIDQTPADEIEPEIPVEPHKIDEPKPHVKKVVKKKKKVVPKRKKTLPSTLDMF